MTLACCDSHEATARAVWACGACGTACCRSCAVKIDAELYCRGCAGADAPPRAA
jgi:hypothetical protein